MLKITIAGEELDLPEDPSINLIYENPLFLNDRIPAPHSLTSELPQTARNLRILNFPNRIHSKNDLKTFNNCSIQFGAVVLLTGSIVITRFEGNLKFHFNARANSSDIMKPQNEIEFDVIDLGDDTEPFDFNDPDSHAYNYKELIESAKVGNEDFICAPVRITEKKEWPGFPNNEIPNVLGLRAMNELYLSFYNVEDQNYFMSNEEGTIREHHSFCVPTLYFYKFIEALFKDTIENNVFSTGELANVALFQNYHERITPRTLNPGIGSEFFIVEQEGFSPTSYFLDLSKYANTGFSNEIIKEVFKTFGCTLFNSRSKNILRFNKDVITSVTTEDWSGHLIDDLSIELSMGDKYAYGYNDYLEKIEVDQENEVDYVKELYDAAVVNIDEEVSFYVTSTNQHISKKLLAKYDPSDPDTYEYKIQNPGYGSSEQKQNAKFDFISNVPPLSPNIHQNWHEDKGFEDPVATFAPIDFGGWYVPEFRGNRFVRQEVPSLLIYWGMQDCLHDNTKKYPFLSDKNYDAYGNRLGNLSLAWDGPDGLIENYHKEFKQWVETDKKRARGYFLLSAIDIKNLDMSKKKHVKGMNFFIEKAEVTIRKNKIEPARVHLIEALDIFTGSGSGSGAGGL